MRERIMQIVEAVTANTDLSDGEQALEVATQLMHAAQIPQHQQEIGEICDLMTALGSVIKGGDDPEEIAPEQLEDIVKPGE